MNGSGPREESGTDASDGDSRRSLLINPRERRLRTGWRLTVALVAVVVAAALGMSLASAVDLVGPSGGTAGALVVILGWTLLYGTLTVAVVGLARYVDRRSLTDLGVGGSRVWANFGFGILTGLAMVSAVFAFESALGVVAVDGTFVTRSGLALGGATQGPLATGIDATVPFGVSLVLLVVFFAGVAVFEEVLFRGYLLTNLAEGLSGESLLDHRTAVLTAAIVTSALFGAVHLANPGARTIGGVNIVLLGLFLAGTFVATGDLGVPIGIHLSWNYAVGTIFGFPVSGIQPPATVLDARQTGNPLVTGGSFGPEGGLVTLVGLAVGVVLTWLWVARTGSEPRPWKRIATLEGRD